MKDKIVFLLTRSDAIGGASVHVSDISKDLVEDGMDVSVLIGGRGPVISLFDHPKLKVISIPCLVRNISPVKDLVALSFILWNLFLEKPDIVSIHTSKVGFLGRFACYLLGKRTIFTPHCWSFAQIGSMSSVYKRLETVLTLFTDVIVCVSRDERSLMIDSAMINPDRLLVIHNGMRESCYVENAIRDEVLNFVQIARFEEQKDFKTLLAASLLLSDKKFVLHLIGDGPLRKAFEKEIDTAGLSEKVCLYRERRDVEKFLLKGRVYVLSTRWEGLPRSIIEAMRASMPVIASDVGGVSELVENSKSGFLFESGDEKTLALRMRLFIESPSLVNEMGQCSRKLYEKKFTYKRMYRIYSNLYSVILKHDG